MANFSNLALTARGVKALLEAQMGTALTLSKIGLGSGTPASGISISELATPELLLTISETKTDSDTGLMTIIAKMTNEDITEGFYWRETGLYFEDADGNDVLFAYAYAEDKYDYVPAYSDQRYVKHVRIANIITNSSNITVKEKDGLLYVDTLTFSEFKEKLNLFLIDIEEGIKKTNENLSDFYSAESTYAAGDYCIYQNVLYKCTVAIDTAEKFTPEHWIRTNVTKELAEFTPNSLALIIGKTEPEKGPVLWFDTTPRTTETEKLLLLLTEADTGYYAEIDGDEQSIENVVESESALTEDTFYIEVNE